MQKQSKNIISREACKKDLQHLARADVYQSAVLLAVVLLIFVPLFCMSIYVSKHILGLGLIFALICAALPIIFAVRLIRRLARMRLIRQNGFSIVKDTVCRLSKDESDGRHTVDALYFTDYGRCTSYKPAFEVSSVGDEFFLVVLHTKKKEICFAFNAVAYECADFEAAD